MRHIAFEVMKEMCDDQCDGCDRKIPVGEIYLTNIESCCGGGCCRRLCWLCVAWIGVHSKRRGGYPLPDGPTNRGRLRP